MWFLFQKTETHVLTHMKVEHKYLFIISPAKFNPKPYVQLHPHAQTYISRPLLTHLNKVLPLIRTACSAPLTPQSPCLCGILCYVCVCGTTRDLGGLASGHIIALHHMWSLSNSRLVAANGSISLMFSPLIRVHTAILRKLRLLHHLPLLLSLSRCH